ncbi:hypothetical protein DDE83_000109 [Stemphylium lycopersici]|uniref:DUF7730 domain-containing protein n=1 Tax=Stemphylium lycopersici TaxID=183478 RepID=A0A364NGU0_STELY|nr:hypothetical protein DDE83_000109 [Stemphylium lycopersici]
MESIVVEAPKISLLISLPKELRLEIWTHVLTDPSVDKPVLRILRQHPSAFSSSTRFHNSLYSEDRRRHLQVVTEFDTCQSHHIDTSLLRTNRFIYEEAMPILYRSVTFHPVDLEGIFPLFLHKLSPFGRSLISHAKLTIPSAIDSSICSFHWALTCAQIAGLEGLRTLSIEHLPRHWTNHLKRSVLRPLLKVKAAKTFDPGETVEAKKLLEEATVEMGAKALLRRSPPLEISTRKAHQSEAEYSIGGEPEQVQTQRDWEQWDMVSVRDLTGLWSKSQSEADASGDGTSFIRAGNDAYGDDGEALQDWELMDA